MVKLLLVICVFSVWAVAEISCATPHNAPAPSVDCSTLILNMADCLTFVSDGSKVTKPEGGCCNGLKMVLKADAQCPCEAFKSSAQMGVVLNVTKAMTLPSACGVNAPSMSTCGLSGVPDAAPAHPPKSSAPSPKLSKSRLPTSTSVAPAAAPTGGSSSATAPALSPAQSDAISVSISFVLAIFSVVAAACFYF